MIKIHIKATLFLLMCFGAIANAQCGSCNTTVSGLSTIDRYVGAGQSLCITATGTITGNIYVGQAGYLCNAGTIKSDTIKVDDGGTFNNYKTINSKVVSVLNGSFYNNGIATIDSFIINQQSAYFYNDSIFNGNSLIIKDHLTAINSGTINVNNFRDSIITFTNNGHIHTYNDMNNESYSNFTNNGTIYIGHDFLNSETSFFYCNNYMEIQHDFSNTSAATFQANCMIQVNHDWRNYAFIHGASNMCGGFNINGFSFSNSSLGVGGRYLDICDAGHPAAGLDVAWGWIDPSNTYCSCNNSCANILTNIKDNHKDYNIINLVYPSPAINTLNIKLNNKEKETLTIEVLDMMGKMVITKTYYASIGENVTEINVADLAQGTYMLSITNSNKLQSKRLFSVAK